MRTSLAILFAGMLGMSACCPATVGTRVAALPQVDRTKMPAGGPLRSFKPPQAESWKLPNGLNVWLVRQTHSPLATLKLVLPYGSTTDPVGKAGLTALMVDLLDEGAAGQSALAISAKLQSLATDYSGGASRDGIVFSMNLLAAKLEPSLAILADFVQRPDFLLAEFERRKSQRMAMALASEAKPSTGRARTMLRVLFGTGYGASPSFGTQTSLGKISLEEVKAHYGRLLAPQGATLVVVGSVSKAQVNAAVTKSLGGWKGAATAQVRALTPSQAPAGTLYFVDYPGSAQSAIAVARRIPGLNSPDLFPTFLYNRVLGGSFVSRINMNLREDKGYTYGARSSMVRWQKAGFFYIGAKVKRDTTQASLVEIKKELAAIVGPKPISTSEFSRARRGLVLGFPNRFQRIGGVASQFGDLALEGRPKNWFKTWLNGIKATTLDQAQKRARHFGDWAGYHVIVAGDWKRLASSVKALGLPIKRYDTQGQPLKGDEP